MADYETVSDLPMNGVDGFEVIDEPSRIRRKLQRRYGTELPVFFLRGELPFHAEVYAATATGDDAPLKRLQ